MAVKIIPAVQYVRMSTEHQQYSLANQAVAIQRYAESHGFMIVKTYFDLGRSGLQLKYRYGLQQLLRDVVSEEPGFLAILVYDVSRWGRFQDTDESAHYEFLCKSAGVPVHYCAETFTNDGSLPSLIMKALKRMMAGEYSRELGVKVFAGQWNVYEKGFRGSGGCPGFGLRRMLVSADGTRKQLLADGERKGIMNDRVILVPGPDEAVKSVQAIYRMFLQDRLGYTQISRQLNSRGIAYRGQKPWNVSAVRTILTHAKYTGWLTYAKTSRTLYTKEVKMPESRWLRVPHPSSKIISEETFASVRQCLAAFTINKSNDQLLDELRMIRAANGRLNSTIIRRTVGATSPASFRYRFGSLMRAYELIGYDVPVARLVATRKRIQGVRAELMQQLQRMFPGDITVCGRGGRTRNWLRLKNGTKVSVRFCIRVAHIVRPAWYVRPVHSERRWTALVALMNCDNSWVEQLLVFRSVPDSRRYVSSESPWLTRGKRLEDISQFLRVVEEVRTARRLKRLKG